MSITNGFVSGTVLLVMLALYGSATASTVNHLGGNPTDASLTTPAGQYTQSRHNIAALSGEILRIFYTNLRPDSPGVYREDVAKLQQSFDSSVLASSLASYDQDDLFKLARQHSMTMTESQSTPKVSLEMSHMGAHHWRVVTPVIVYLIKDHIEIVRSMTNTMILIHDPSAHHSYRVTEFKSQDQRAPEMIDHRALRQAYCDDEKTS